MWFQLNRICRFIVAPKLIIILFRNISIVNCISFLFSISFFLEISWISKELTFKRNLL
jgi:hypothetical protein